MPHTTPPSPLPRACQLVGANPTASLRKISLAVRSHLRAWIEEFPEGVVVVACSGGADSAALALCTADQCYRLQIPAAAVVVDHQLRPESAAEAALVAQRLRTWGGLEVFVTAVKVGSVAGPEGAARQARYQALARQAAQFAAGRPVAVLLGHTLDDQAETVLLGLARGSGARSIQAMAPRDESLSITWLRPLLGLRRADTQAACQQAGIEFVSDPSNLVDGPWRAQDGSPLRRAFVRHEVLPLMARAFGKELQPNLARTAHLLRRDEAALNQWALSVLAAATLEDSPPTLDVSHLEGLPRAVLTRSLRLAALKGGAKGGELNFTHLEAVADLVDDFHGQGPIQLPGAVSVQRHKGQDGSSVLVFTK